MDFDDIKRDNISGAAEILKNTAACWLREIRENRESNLQISLDNLRSRGLAIITMHPRMAPLFNLVNSVLCAAEEATSVDMLRRKAEQAINSVLAQLESASARLIAFASSLITPGAQVLTFSRSSIVMSFFFDLQKQHKDFGAMICESRPMLEGKKAAIELARSGIPTTYFVDAAMSLAVRECDIILVGADSFSEQKIVNKVGTRALALLAREEKKPIYCLAPMLKYMPGIRQQCERKKAGEEVWADPPAGVTISNYYFEETPIQLFSDVATEKGFFKKMRRPKCIEKYSSWLLGRLNLSAAQAPTATPSRRNRGTLDS